MFSWRSGSILRASKSSDAGSAPHSRRELSRGIPNVSINGAARTNKATLDALGRSLAIIEFDPKGKILSANENFCKALGYQASEIIGQHHSMFVEPDYARSAGISGILGQARPRRIRRSRIQAHRQRRTERLDPGLLQSGDQIRRATF